MPFYVYRCQVCAADFERLRTMGQADNEITCPLCGATNSARRKLTTFAALSSSSRSASSSTEAPGTGGGCCGGNCGCGRN